jgi:outer membrane immunogenic protein
MFMFKAAAIFILFPIFCFAQTDFGIKAGLNISDIVMTNYIDPDVEADLSIKLGLHAGFFVNGVVNDKIGMSAELLYSDKGVRGSTNIHLHYITLPLLFQYRLTDHIQAELGPEPGYLFSARSEHGDVSSTYNNKFDISLNGGFRFDTPKLLFGIRYCAGVFSVREPVELIGASGREKIKYQNRVLQLSIGYKILSLE